MKSNICKLSKDLTCLTSVLEEVEKVSAYNGLEGKSALRLRLLAEELCGMLRGLLENFEGEFRIEADGGKYEFHVALRAENMSLEVRNELISVSKSGKNAAAKGIMGKIRAVTERMLLVALDPSIPVLTGEPNESSALNMGFEYVDPTIAVEAGYAYSWSLFNYKNAVDEKEEDAYSELERSIVARLADDITVGILGKNVEIVVKKTFAD